MNLLKISTMTLFLMCLQPTCIQAMNDDDNDSSIGDDRMYHFTNIEQFTSLNNTQIKKYLISMTQECRRRRPAPFLSYLIADKYPKIYEEVITKYHYADISEEEAVDTEKRFAGLLLRFIQNYSSENLQYLTEGNTKSNFIKNLAQQALDKKCRIDEPMKRSLIPVAQTVDSRSAAIQKQSAQRLSQAPQDIQNLSLDKKECSCPCVCQ